MTDLATYNFAYLDEQTKRMIRRAILKAVAIPGYQVPFASREMPMPYGWGTGGVQVTSAVIGPDDVLKVIDQGADDTTNAVSIRAFFAKVAGVATTTRTDEATVIQTRHRIPETPLTRGPDPRLPGADSRAAPLPRAARDRDPGAACA
jgi:alpha-D-ribose 1-methylphosphonate 5-phosphate C-P lyase